MNNTSIQQEAGIWRQISESVYYFCTYSILQQALASILGLILHFPPAGMVVGGVIGMICYIVRSVGLHLYAWREEYPVDSNSVMISPSETACWTRLKSIP